MSDNIIDLDSRRNPWTSEKIDPDKVLSCAVGKLNEVLVLGIDKDGNKYFASSCGDLFWNHFRATKFSRKVLNGDFDADPE